MKKALFAALVGLIAGGVVMQVGSVERAEAQAAPPQPSSSARPLHDWMDEVLMPVVEAGDTARLAELYVQIARFAPDPSWNEGPTGWATLSNQAAEKARAGDLRGAKGACKQCHQAWRERYRTEFRSRPLPR